MDDTALLQQYRINAMHGHDVGVWLCEGSGLYLSPVLFMQALCPHLVPRPLFVKWKPTTPPPKAFQKSGTLPLIYSECGRIPPWPYHLHMFAPQAPIAQAFEQANGLQDWSIAVPVIGIIVIFDQKYDRPPSALSLSRLIHRSPQPEANKTLAWAREQHLPYVIALVGYDDTSASVQQFRSRYDLGADVPVLPGPALADTRQRGAQADQTGGKFASMFERQKLGLDSEFARAVLGALYRLTERGRQTP